MAIPDYQSAMLPLLQFAQDQKEHSKQEAVKSLEKFFNLTEDEIKVLLPSGRQPMFDNRVAWAKSYLKQAGLIETTRRGYFKITQRGLGVLRQNPEKINVTFLKQFSEFVDFIKGGGSGDKEENTDTKKLQEQTPEEIFEIAYQGLRKELAQDLLDNIKQSSPKFFEKLVIDLLLAMGYGGSLRDAGESIGRVGDEGIDGIIKEDRLGLDVIYIQAKRWEGAVGRPEIHKFVGALEGKRAKKGIFITTSSFTQEALGYVQNIASRIILIDGQQLSELMIDYNVGVSKTALYEIKKVDSDYFVDE